VELLLLIKSVIIITLEIQARAGAKYKRLQTTAETSEIHRNVIETKQ
jgi:hypothetical protein